MSRKATTTTAAAKSARHTAPRFAPREKRQQCTEKRTEKHTGQHTGQMKAVASIPHRPRPQGDETPVSQRLAVVREHIANLRLALEGLVDLGLCVESVDLLNGRGKPVLTMAPSPYLHQICCPVNMGQKQIGNTRFLRFTAGFGGVTLDWWESAREAA